MNFLRKLGRDNGKEVLVRLCNLMGELHLSLLKNLVPAAKKFGADLFEIAASLTGEIVSRRKKLKTVAKDVGTKLIRKKKSKRRLH